SGPAARGPDRGGALGRRTPRSCGAASARPAVPGRGRPRAATGTAPAAAASTDPPTTRRKPGIAAAAVVGRAGAARRSMGRIRTVTLDHQPDRADAPHRPPRTVGLVVKRDRPRASRLARRIAAALRRRHVAVLADEEAGLTGVAACSKEALARAA